MKLLSRKTRKNKKQAEKEAQAKEAKEEEIEVPERFKDWKFPDYGPRSAIHV